MGLRPPSLFGTRKYRLKNPRSMSDWGTSSIAPFCRREKSSCCSTEAFEALFSLSDELHRSGGDSSQTEVCNWTELCGEPKAIPLVDAPICEWNAIEEAECRIEEDIPDFGLSPSTTKESPWRPCLGCWRVKHWAERWPARGPYAVGENRLCLLTRGPLTAERRMVEGEGATHPPTAKPKKNDTGLLLHTKSRGVGVKSSQVTFIYIALLTIQIVTKHCTFYNNVKWQDLTLNYLLNAFHYWI